MISSNMHWQIVIWSAILVNTVVVGRSGLTAKSPSSAGLTATVAETILSITGQFSQDSQEKQASQPPATRQDKAQRDKAEIPQVTEEQPMSFWMAKKLDYSKAILEALTKGDYDRLALDAERLRVLGKLEGIVRNRNKDYRLQLKTFDLATQELVSSARRERAEAASLAFNHLTNSCVSCHQLLREQSR